MENEICGSLSQRKYETVNTLPVMDGAKHTIKLNANDCLLLPGNISPWQPAGALFLPSLSSSHNSLLPQFLDNNGHMPEIIVKRQIFFFLNKLD